MQSQRNIVTSDPENSETPLASVASLVTPTRLFFVRNHFAVPTVSSEAAEVRLDGLVERPAHWTFDELAAMPQHTVFATVECAGNGRSFLREKVAGVQWGPGAIGHAEWTGVRVRDLLSPAVIKPGAREVVFYGADEGIEDGEQMDFSRSLPLEKALHPDTIVALRMNGEWLDPNHGAPMRLFVPGWYGVASVKWLRRIEVIDHAYQGFFQTVKYSVDRMTADGKRRMPLGPGVVKSEIFHPTADEKLGFGTNRIDGVAWAGEDRIARVDISTDGGRTWHAAHLKGVQQPYSWCQWETLWTVTVPGVYTILARAHAQSGQTQPFEYDPDNLGYIINTVLPRKVHVSADHQSLGDFADAAAWSDMMAQFADRNTRRPLDIEMSYSSGGGI